MKHIKIKYTGRDGIFSIGQMINDALFEYGIQIELYDDSRVYFTTERSRDVRLDCAGGLG